MAKVKQKKGVIVSKKFEDKRDAHYDKPEVGEDGKLHSKLNIDQSKELRKSILTEVDEYTKIVILSDYTKGKK